MIHWSHSSIAFPSFTGAEDDPLTPDVIRFVQASDPLVLEAALNTVGQAEAGIGRALCGLQIAGAGKGNVFTVMALFDSIGGVGGATFAVGTGTGCRAFCFSGETAEALYNDKELARARMLAFCAGRDSLSYRMFEIAGGNDGQVYMGIVVVTRGAPT